MEEMGMTDLQFKSYLKQLIRNIEDAKDEKDEEERNKKLDEIIKDLREDLQG